MKNRSIHLACLVFCVVLGSACNDSAIVLTTPAPLLQCQARAINLVCWSPGCFQVASITDALRAIKDLGVNAVQIVPTWYQDKANSNQISASPDKSPTLDEIRSAVQLAKQEGLRVTLKPHVDLLDGNWRGQIEPASLRAWQASYQNFILTFADLAEEEQVEILSIGTELKSQSQNRAFWSGLIMKVRSHYHGFLTYSANWDEYSDIPFWNLLDFIGLDFYFPLTDDPNATEAALETSLANIQQSLQSFSEGTQKTLLITELGYRSVDGAVTKPYDFTFTGSLDLQEQADAYQAFLTVFKDGKTWVEEIAWWALDPELQGGTNDTGYSPYGKPAADVLKSSWQALTCP